MSRVPTGEVDLGRPVPFRGRGESRQSGAAGFGGRGRGRAWKDEPDAKRARGMVRPVWEDWSDAESDAWRGGGGAGGPSGTSVGAEDLAGWRHPCGVGSRYGGGGSADERLKTTSQLGRGRGLHQEVVAGTIAGERPPGAGECAAPCTDAGKRRRISASTRSGSSSAAAHGAAGTVTVPPPVLAHAGGRGAP